MTQPPKQSLSQRWIQKYLTTPLSPVLRKISLKTSPSTSPSHLRTLRKWRVGITVTLKNKIIAEMRQGKKMAVTIWPECLPTCERRQTNTRLDRHFKARNRCKKQANRLVSSESSQTRGATEGQRRSQARSKAKSVWLRRRRVKKCCDGDTVT